LYAIGGDYRHRRSGEPAFVLNSHRLLRDGLFNQSDKIQGICWHRPLIGRGNADAHGDGIGQLKVVPEEPDDHAIDNDLILVWGLQGALSPVPTC
jgi:hypothetical protein